MEQDIQIREFIRTRCKGSGNARHFRTLSLLLKIEERTLRDIVASLVTNAAAPIAGSQEGYFWISNKEEFELAHDELIKRIKKLSRRAKGLRHAWEAEKKSEEIKPYQECMF